MVFAHLVNHQIEPVLDFLSGVPAPTGHSALEFILDIWCQCHPLFFGAYEKKVRYVCIFQQLLVLQDFDSSLLTVIHVNLFALLIILNCKSQTGLLKMI